MADEVVNIELNVDASDGIKTMKELNTEIEKTAKTTGGLEQRAEELKEQLKDVEIGTAEFKKLRTELQGVEGQLKDLDLQFEALDFEQKLTAATDAATGVAGGFAAVQGAIALAGVESEEFEETMIRVQGAMALAMGVRDIGVAVVALRKLGAVTKVAAAIQKVFNLILSLNPIGIIIIAVTALIAALLLFPNVLRKIIKGFNELGDVAKVVIAILGGPFIAVLIIANEVAKALGVTMSEEEIAEQKREKARRARIREQIKALEAQRDELRKLSKARQEASDEYLAGLDFELRKAKANGEDTVQLERDKLKAVIIASEERIKTLEQELAIEAEIVKKKTELNEALFKSNNAFSKSIKETILKDNQENLDNLQKQIDEAKNLRIKTSKDLEVFEITQTKKRRDQGRKAAEEQQKELERQANEERDRREAEGELLLSQAELLDELRLKNLEEGLEKEKEIRQREFDLKIQELTNNALLTAEIEKELRTQLNTDLAEIDQKFKDEELKRQEEVDAKKSEADKKDKEEKLMREQELVDAKVAIEQAAFSISESLIALSINNEEKADKARKILAGAQLAVDTAKAISGAIAQAQNVPFPGNIAAIATGIAAVLANMAKAKSLLQSAGVSNIPSFSGASGSSSAPRINPLSSGSTIIPDNSDTRVIVVESDITETQNKVATIENQATL